jgi:hypothetical protein
MRVANNQQKAQDQSKDALYDYNRAANAHGSPPNRQTGLLTAANDPQAHAAQLKTHKTATPARLASRPSSLRPSNGISSESEPMLRCKQRVFQQNGTGRTLRDVEFKVRKRQEVV